MLVQLEQKASGCNTEKLGNEDDEQTYLLYNVDDIAYHRDSRMRKIEIQ